MLFSHIPPGPNYVPPIMGLIRATAASITSAFLIAQLLLLTPSHPLVDPMMPRSTTRCIFRRTYSSYCLEAAFCELRVTEFSEVQLRDAERLSVRRVMSSSCSQLSPTKM
jgi:hypothetical protein